MTLEERLRELASDTPPPELEASTLVSVGAADLVARSDSPYGDVWIAWSTRGFTGLTPGFAAPTLEAFLAGHRRPAYGSDRLPRELEEVAQRALASGDTVGLPIDLSGMGSFATAVLGACSSIPPGSVRPYGWIADAINKPGAVRAVGTALARNPIPLLIPCHRVVRSDGAVGQYAFGADMKHDLLVREGALLA